jgi:hypothetical protein
MMKSLLLGKTRHRMNPTLKMRLLLTKLHRSPSGSPMKKTKRMTGTQQPAPTALMLQSQTVLKRSPPAANVKATATVGIGMTGTEIDGIITTETEATAESEPDPGGMILEIALTAIARLIATTEEIPNAATVATAAPARRRTDAAVAATADTGIAIAAVLTIKIVAEGIDPLRGILVAVGTAIPIVESQGPARPSSAAGEIVIATGTGTLAVLVALERGMAVMRMSATLSALVGRMTATLTPPLLPPLTPPKTPPPCPARPSKAAKPKQRKSSIACLVGVRAKRWLVVRRSPAVHRSAAVPRVEEAAAAKR